MRDQFKQLLNQLRWFFSTALMKLYEIWMSRFWVVCTKPTVNVQCWAWNKSTESNGSLTVFPNFIQVNGSVVANLMRSHIHSLFIFVPLSLALVYTFSIHYYVACAFKRVNRKQFQRNISYFPFSFAADIFYRIK